MINLFWPGVAIAVLAFIGTITAVVARFRPGHNNVPGSKALGNLTILSGVFVAVVGVLTALEAGHP